MKEKKIIIIGLDGGTWTILNPLMEQGKAPFFSHLCKNGIHGILRSTTPPVTAPAWTSFLTGQNPGRHGLYDFQWIDFTTNNRNLTVSTDCKSANIIDYLNDEGKRSLFINVPLTFPPYPINGILVAGFPVPPESDFVYPPEMLQQIKKLNYITDWMEIYRNNKSQSKVSMIKMADKSQINVFASMLKQYDWEVAMIVISGTDHIAHLEWQKGNVNAVKNYYSYIDGILYKLHHKGLFADATIVVVSDHGFGGASYSFFMNTWLSKEGYLRFKSEKDDTYDVFLREFRNTVYGKRNGILSRMLKTINLTRENLIYLGKKTGLIKLERYLPHSIISVFPSHEFSIDWSNTKAYIFSNASKGININLQDREKTGIVTRNEYDGLRKEIVEKLRRLKSVDGSPIFQIADLKENIYSGPYVPNAPDIVTWPFPNYKIRIGTNQKNFLRKVIESQHTLEGIYIFSGDDFLSKKWGREISIMDIAPTIMHIMGLQVPEDMDGKVATDFFAPYSSARKREIQFRTPLSKNRKAVTAETNQEGVAEKLRALGYL
jgi:predicted AlkP superfamily phosphohydrolase/phosphomutase